MKRSADPNSDKMRAEFRQKLENYQAAPSDNLWDKIELSLDKEEALVYKNRFRVYSRLAAACLLLLLAFGTFFIPNKLSQLQHESPEIASAQNSASSQTRSPEIQQPETETAAPSGITSAEKTLPNQAENGSYVVQKTAKSVSGTNLHAQQQIAFKAESAGNTPASKSPYSKKSTETGMVAFNTSKVKPEAPEAKIRENSAENSKNAMLSAAKTTVAQNTGKATYASATPETAAPNLVNSVMPEMEETPKLGIARASKTEGNETAATSPRAAKSATAAISSFGNKNVSDETATVAETSTSTFSAPNATVSETAKDRKGFSLFSFKSVGLKTAGSEPALPDSIALAVLPVADAPAEKVKNSNRSAEAGKWQVALAYGGGAFNSGMRLGNQAQFQPSGNLVPPQQLQARNMAQYDAAIREFNDNINPAYSQSFSFLTGFKISKNWLVQSGLKFVRNQSRSRSHYAFSRKKTIGSTNYDSVNQHNTQTVFEVALNNNFDPDLTEIHQTEAMETTYRFQQVGVPVSLRFQTHGEALYYFVGAGFAIYRTKEAIVTENGQETSYPVIDPGVNYNFIGPVPPMVFRKWLPAWHLQTGIGYKLTQHWQLEMALEGEKYLKPLFQNEHETGALQQKPGILSGAFKVAYSF